MIQIGNKKFHNEGKTVYIGRPSPLGNPFPVKKSRFETKIYSVEESLKLYRLWLWSKIQAQDSEVLKALNEIKNENDITLICWCVDKTGKGECHGFIIRDCVNWMRTTNQAAN